MKKIILSTIILIIICGCKQKSMDSEDGTSVPMIERKHSYMQKTQEENAKDIDTTDIDDYYEE